MVKKKNSKKISLERETRVIIEKMSTDLRTVAEGHSFLHNKLEEIDNIVRELRSTSFKTEMNIEGIKSKISTTDIKLDRIEKELETVKVAAMDIGSKMRDQEERVKKLELIK